MSIEPQRKFTIAEYLAREERSETKHEFDRGEIFAMAGGSIPHGVIATNIIVKLSQLLAGRGCRPYSSDHRICIPDSELHTYPDGSVVCGTPEVDPTDRHAITNPLAIVEVLSPSTEKYDRGKKFEFYRRIESFREYLLVEQSEARIECYSRSDDGRWKIEVANGLEASITIPALGCTLALKDVYVDVRFPPLSSDEILPPQS